MFKIEYDPNYTLHRYVVYKFCKVWFSKTWIRVASFPSEEEANSAIEVLKSYPKYF